MEVIAVSGPQDFLTLSREFRAAEPYVTNVIGSIAHGVLGGREYESCHWWIARESGRVVGLAVRTAPHSLVLAPMAPDANAAIAEAVAEVFPRLPGIGGPVEQVGAYQRLLNPSKVTVRVDEVIYVLRDFSPATASGSARPATPADEQLLSTWMRQFQIDAGLPLHNVRAGVDRMLSYGWLWETDGEPVAMAGHAHLVGEPGAVIGRIGPVFTPEGKRRQGFGAAITSTLVTHLQSQCDHIMLYADAANPTSNSVYQKLGFVEYSRVAEVDFTY